MTEDRETRLKRLHMRSIRRGIKEMDLILTTFSERGLAALSATELDLYEQLLAENDQDLYAWVTEQSVPPEVYQNLIKNIRQLFNIK